MWDSRNIQEQSLVRDTGGRFFSVIWTIPHPWEKRNHTHQPALKFSYVLLVLSREWMGMGEWDDYY